MSFLKEMTETLRLTKCITDIKSRIVKPVQGEFTYWKSIKDCLYSEAVFSDSDLIKLFYKGKKKNGRLSNRNPR